MCSCAMRRTSGDERTFSPGACAGAAVAEQIQQRTGKEARAVVLGDKTGSDWFEYSHASCHEPTILIHIAYSDRLVRRFPGVAGFLSGMSFQYDDLNKVIFSMIGNKPQKARVARLWVERNAERLQQLAAFAVKH